MNHASPTLIYERNDCAVLAIEGGQTPSFVMSFEQGSRLCALFKAASEATSTLPPSGKTAPIRDLCSFLEQLIVVYGRGVIEWDASRTHPPEVKAAALEVLSAVKELERIRGDHGPDNA